MLLLELAIQGVRSLPAIQLKIQPQAHAIVATRQVLASLTRALRALLVGVDESAPVLLAPGANMAQAAVTFRSADRTIFRLGRDLCTGRARLSQYSADTRTFVTLTEDTQEATQLLRVRAGLCDSTTFDQAFIFASDQFPSRTDVAGLMQPRGSVAKAEDGDTQQRIAELEQQLRSSHATDGLEFDLDGLQKQRFALDDQLQRLADPDTGVARAQADLARQAALPADFGDRYARYREIVARREQDLKRWDEEQKRLATSDERARQPVLHKGLVAAGSALGLAGLMTSLILGGRWRYLALVDIPSFGLAAALLWRYFDRRDWLTGQTRRGARYAERRQRIIDRDADIVTMVENTMRELGLDSQREVDAAVAARRQAEEAVRLAFVARSENDTTAERDALLAQRSELDSKIATIEEQLQQAGLGINIGALRVELAQLRVSKGEEPLPITVPVSAGEQAAQLVAMFTRHACDLWLVDAVAANERLVSVAASVLASITSRQLLAIEFATSSLIVRAANGHTFAWQELPNETRDTVYAALRLALVVGCDERSCMPAIVTDAPEIDWMAAVVPSELGQRGRQVLLLTDDATHVGAGVPTTSLT